MERKFEIGEIVLLSGSSVNHTPNTYYFLNGAFKMNTIGFYENRYVVSCGGYHFDAETGVYVGTVIQCLHMRINHCDKNDGVREMMTILSDIFNDVKF